MSRKNKDLLPNQFVSRSVDLTFSFTMPEAQPIPENMSPESWDVIIQAIEFVHQVEIVHLDAIISKYVARITKAEACGCAQCRKGAEILSKQLHEELKRQTEFFESETQRESDSLVEQIAEEIDAYLRANRQRDTQRRLEQEAEKFSTLEHKEMINEWDKRTERLRQLIHTYLLGKNNHHVDPLSQKERNELRQLLTQARNKRNKSKK